MSRRISAGDEDSVRRWQVLLDRAELKAAVESGFARFEAELVQSGAGLGDQLVLVGRANLGREVYSGGVPR